MSCGKLTPRLAQVAWTRTCALSGRPNCASSNDPLFESSQPRVDASPYACRHSEFFTNMTIRGAFQDYARAVVERFSSNPWVLAWELANDPVCAVPALFVNGY